MGVSKVLARGQITLPRQVRQAAGIAPGDNILVRITGPRKLELTILPGLTLAEALNRYHIEETIDDANDRVAWQQRASGRNAAQSASI